MQWTSWSGKGVSEHAGATVAAVRAGVQARRWVQGRWSEACEQYQAMLRQAHCPPPDSDTFTMMLWACLEQRDPLCALRIVQDATSLSKPLRAPALQQLIAQLQDTGMHDAASALQRAVAL